MTPSARVATAIEILDRIAGGRPAEQALTNWARGARHAGSGDRAAVRDHVFDVLRRWWSTARDGGAATGRGRMIGLLRQCGIEPATVFTGATYAPAPLDPGEGAPDFSLATPAAIHDVPDWALVPLRASLGDRMPAILAALRDRAPVFVRVNTRLGTRGQAIASLAREAIPARPGPLSPTALEITGNPRAIAASRTMASGLIELQDAASQAVVDRLPLADGMRVLDYCAGGGGKSLAMAARADLTLDAHDIDPARMADLPRRADRAGVRVTLRSGAGLARGGYDLVLADAPCSGSGAWRRSPDAKRRFAPGDLATAIAVQRDVLDRAAALVRPGGYLAYATCSLLASENADQVSRWTEANPAWSRVETCQWTPLDGADGFFVAVMSH